MHSIIIETERLILRPLKIEDANAVFEWVSDERVTRYMVYNTYTSINQVVEWLKTEFKQYHFGFVKKADGQLIGSGSIGPSSKKNDFWEFGYNFRYDCWGKGYATEAVKAMIKYVNDNLKISKFISQHAEPNKASGRVMENVDCIL